jgi:diguanylate cyclase (GGDEF)-like protein
LSVTGGQLRLGLFAAVFALLIVNALGVWSDQTARSLNTALQGLAGAGALVCALVVASKVKGPARTWRLLVVGGFTSWLVAEGLWWSAQEAGASSAPWLAVVVYFLPPVLSGIALVVVAFGWDGVRGPRSALSYTRLLAILDGAVAALSFVILVVIAGSGGMTGAAVPRSDNNAVMVAYAGVELVVVVGAVLMGMGFRADRPYRQNYLLLAGGVVMLATSDRLIAYLTTVGVERADLWGGFGFVLGPMLIGYSVLRRSSTPAEGISSEAMNWLQLTLPYIGFLGIAFVYVFHLLMGHRLSTLELYAALLMITVVTVRQVVAMRAQRLLTKRLLEARRSLAHQVHHDALTALPNRVLFAERLDQAIADGPFVLIFVDLDDFKEVNDRFGHAGGDELLCAVGERLARCIGEGDTLARIGGDEFAILITGGDEPPEVVADRIRVALRDPFAIHGSSIRVRASMGLVRPDLTAPRPTSDDLLRQADVSMYAGKRVGKNTAVVFRPSLGVSTDFPTALRQAQGGVPAGFSLAYQPVVTLPDAAPVAVEALARWTAPNGTDIQPDAFVAAAEAAGLGAALDAMVLDLACSELQSAGVDHVLHVNIGAARLGSLEFEQRVLRTLDRCGLTPNQLVLEITETVPVVDLADAAAQIERLNAIGIKVALDDFGAGYSSLTYLHALPVQIIKLDRGLAVGSEPARIETLYRSVIRLCDSLGIDVIAEGIESTAQADTVFTAGCRLAQGHLFGRAAPIANLGVTGEVPSGR